MKVGILLVFISLSFAIPWEPPLLVPDALSGKPRRLQLMEQLAWDRMETAWRLCEDPLDCHIYWNPCTWPRSVLRIFDVLGTRDVSFRLEEGSNWMVIERASINYFNPTITRQ